MSIIINASERTFEENKDNPQVQALLELLGSKREQVISWQIDNHAQHPNYATFHVVFADESEARGYISFVPQHNNWIAGGSHIPAFQAKRISQAKEQAK